MRRRTREIEVQAGGIPRRLSELAPRELLLLGRRRLLGIVHLHVLELVHVLDGREVLAVTGG